LSAVTSSKGPEKRFRGLDDDTGKEDVNSQASSDESVYDKIVDKPSNSKLAKANESNKKTKSVVKSSTCIICGCEDHSKELGCCDVCRRYGREGKQPCKCYDCGVSDGKRNDNSTIGMITYISNTLKELLDSFMKLVDRNDRTNFKRHKIDAMISSESKNGAKFKYTNCFVGETGKIIKCCFIPN
jgi:hypothetical protein